MKFLLLAIVALAVVAVSANIVERDVLYTRYQPASGWTMLGRAKATDKVFFTVGLQHRNMAKLEKIVSEVSDPTHENYQEFMSIKAINDLTAPAKKHHDAVVTWLVNSGVKRTAIKSFRSALDVHTTVAVAEKIFATHMHYYANVKEGTVVVKQYGPYSAPKKIAKYIDIVTGLSTFPIPHLTLKKRKTHKGKGAPLDTVGIVAQSIQALYNLPSTQTPNSAPQTSVGCIEFQGQNFAPSDSDYYAQQVGVTIVDVPANQTIGPNDPTNPQTEAELDIQMIQTTNTEASPWFWLESGNGWLYQFGAHIFSTQNVPQVNSISYGWWEGDQCTIDPDECQSLGVSSQGYVNAVNAQFAKIAARGIALVSATGDSGANGRTDPDCSTAQLRPAFPGSSPYVTAVGATQINNPVNNLPTQPAACTAVGLVCPSGGQEVAVSYDVASFASGGGFSNYAAQPSWQATAVNAYLNSGTTLPPASYFNSTGRGFPDIAAVGHNNIIAQSGALEAVGGTSASTPINSAILAYLNQAVIAKTGKPLGFLNPFLYQAYAANPLNFNDITVGDNKCTEDGCSASCQGFLCAKGWDPVTGLGSLNYANLLSYVQSNKFAPHKALKHKKSNKH
jgi:subtilase family serine protease